MLGLELGVMAVLGQALGGDDRLLRLLGELAGVHSGPPARSVPVRRDGGQRRAAAQSVDLIEEAERHLDAGPVEAEVVMQPADLAQPGHLRFAEVDPPTLDARGREQADPDVVADACRRHVDLLGRGLERAVAGAGVVHRRSSRVAPVPRSRRRPAGTPRTARARAPTAGPAARHGPRRGGRPSPATCRGAACPGRAAGSCVRPVCAAGMVSASVGRPGSARGPRRRAAAT